MKVQKKITPRGICEIQMRSTLNSRIFHYTFFLFVFTHFAKNAIVFGCVHVSERAFTKIIAHFHYVDWGIPSILYKFFGWKSLAIKSTSKVPFILSCLLPCECRRKNVIKKYYRSEWKTEMRFDTMKCKITTERWWWNYKCGQPRGHFTWIHTPHTIKRWSVAQHLQHHRRYHHRHSHGRSPQNCDGGLWNVASGEIHSCEPHKMCKSSNFPSTTHLCSTRSIFLFSLSLYFSNLDFSRILSMNYAVLMHSFPFLAIALSVRLFKCNFNGYYVQKYKRRILHISLSLSLLFYTFFLGAYLCMSLLVRKPPAWWIW